MAAVKIVVLCSSSHEGIYCEHAVVAFDPQAVLARRDLRQTIASRDDRVDTVDFWDGGATYYENLDLDALLTDRQRLTLEQHEWCVVADDFEVPEGVAVMRTDGERCVIDSTTFYWQAYDRYGGARFETRQVTYAVLMPRKRWRDKKGIVHDLMARASVGHESGVAWTSVCGAHETTAARSLRNAAVTCMTCATGGAA